MVLCNMTTPAGLKVQEVTDTKEASMAAQESLAGKNSGSCPQDIKRS